MPLSSTKAAELAAIRWKNVPPEQRRLSTEKARVAAAVNRITRSELSPEQVAQLRAYLAGAA